MLLLFSAIDWRKRLLEASFPLGMFVSLLALQIFWKPIGLPDITEIVHWIRGWFDIYGLWALGFFGFVEALFMLGIYLPGSMAILTGIAVYSGDFFMLVVITAVCWMAFMLAMIVNYALGYYGFYRIFDAVGGRHVVRQMHGYLARWGAWTFAVAAWHPNWLSVANVCAGIGQIGWRKALMWSGLGMALSGPVMVFGFAQIIDSVMKENGVGIMSFIFIGVFLVWGLAIFLWGICQDMRGQP